MVLGPGSLVVLLGGYLTTLTAPWLFDSPWTGDQPSVGFSIVVYAVLMLCTSLIIAFIAGERLFGRSPERWKRLLATAIILLLFLFSFISGVRDLPQESILGHCIGVALGIVAAAVYWLVHRIRRQDTAQRS